MKLFARESITVCVSERDGLQAVERVESRADSIRIIVSHENKEVSIWHHDNLMIVPIEDFALELELPPINQTSEEIDYYLNAGEQCLETGRNFIRMANI